MSASSSPRDIIIVDNEESPRIIKFRQITVEEQHEEFVNEIKRLKKENEQLYKVVRDLTISQLGIADVYMKSPTKI
jgi:uncharacterized protein (UPF0335 family)